MSNVETQRRALSSYQSEKIETIHAPQEEIEPTTIAITLEQRRPDLVIRYLIFNKKPISSHDRNRVINKIILML